MKKIISTLLVFSIIISMVSPCFAAQKQVPLEEVLDYIQTLYPGAEVEVSSDGTLQIFALNQTVSSSRGATSIYAPEGGYFGSFQRPAFTSPYDPEPYSIMFLPYEKVNDLDLIMDDQVLFDQIVQWVADGLGIPAIIVEVAKVFNKTVTKTAILFYTGIKFYELLDWIDRKMFTEARKKSPNLCVQRLIIQGWPSNAYLSWDGKYVSPGAFEGWNPTFYRGVFDFE